MKFKLMLPDDDENEGVSNWFYCENVLGFRS